MFSSSPRPSNSNQHLRHPNNISHPLQPSPISRPTTPNLQPHNQRSRTVSGNESRNLTPISSPAAYHGQRTPIASTLNPASRSPNPKRPTSSHRTIDSTSSSEYSLSAAAPIAGHGSGNGGKRNQRQDASAQKSANAFDIQQEILQSYLMGMANPVGVGNGNGTRNGAGGSQSQQSNIHQQVLDEYGLGSSLNHQQYLGSQKDGRRKSSSGRERVHSFNSSLRNGAMGGGTDDARYLSSSLNINIYDNENGMTKLGKRKSRSSFLQDQFDGNASQNRAGVGSSASSYSQPLPQEDFNHYYEPQFSSHSSSSNDYYKTSQQSPVPSQSHSKPPPRSPRNKSKPINRNGFSNFPSTSDSPPPSQSSSNYSQESSLSHHQQSFDFPSPPPLNLAHQKQQLELQKTRRRSRSLSKIIAHDAAMGEQLRYTLTPPIPSLDQGHGQFNSTDREQSYGKQESGFKMLKVKKDRDSNRIRSISTSGLDLVESKQESSSPSFNGSTGLSHQQHLLVGDENGGAGRSSTLKRRSRTSSNLSRSPHSNGAGGLALEENSIRSAVSSSGLFPSEMNGLNSFDQSNSIIGRKRSNSHCLSAVDIELNSNQASILSTPTSTVKNRKSIQLSPRSSNISHPQQAVVQQSSSQAGESNDEKRSNGRRSSFNGDRKEAKATIKHEASTPVTVSNLKKVEMRESLMGSTQTEETRLDSREPESYLTSDRVGRPSPKSAILATSNYDSSSLASFSASETNLPFRPPRSTRRASTVQPLRIFSKHSQSQIEGDRKSAPNTPSLPKSPLSISIPINHSSNLDSSSSASYRNESQLSASPQVDGGFKRSTDGLNLDLDLDNDFISHSTDLEEQKRLSSNSIRRKKRNSGLNPKERRNSSQQQDEMKKEDLAAFRKEISDENKSRVAKVEREEAETRAAVEAGERSAAARATVRGRVRRTQIFETNGAHVQDFTSNTTITSQAMEQVSSTKPLLQSQPDPISSTPASSEPNEHPHAAWLKDQERRLAADDLTSIAQSQTTESNKALSESDVESADRIRIHSATASEQGRSAFDEEENLNHGNGQFDDVDGGEDGDGGVEWEMMPSPLRQGIDSAIEMWRRSTESFRHEENLEPGHEVRFGMSNAAAALRKLQEAEAESKEDHPEEEEEEGIEETTQTQIRPQSQLPSQTPARRISNQHQPQIHPSRQEEPMQPELQLEPESEGCFSAKVEETELDQFEMVDSNHSRRFQSSRNPPLKIQEERRSSATCRFSPSPAPLGESRNEQAQLARRSLKKAQPYEVWAAPEPSIVNSNSGTTLSHGHPPGSFPMGGEILDALDQPLRLYQGGMGSASRSTITNEEPNEEVDFSTGLGLFFDSTGPASSATRLPEKEIAQKPPRPTNRSVRLSCHDLAALCDAAQFAGSDDQEEGEDDDNSSSAGSFASAEEGEDGDWSTSKRGSKASIAWVQAAGNFERQYPSRDSVSWRTSMAFGSNSPFHSHTNSVSSSDRRRSILAQEAAASIDRRLSMVARNHHRASRQFQLASHYEERVGEENPLLTEEDDHLEGDELDHQEGSNFEFEMVNGKHQDQDQDRHEPVFAKDLEREQVPALSRPASISTTEDGIEIPTPSFQTVSLPMSDLHSTSLGPRDHQYQYQHHSHDQSSISIGPGPGDADSDPEDLRLSSIKPPSVKRPSSRRWSAMPPPTSNPIINEPSFHDSHLDQEATESYVHSQSQTQAVVFERDESTGMASRRLSRRASVIRKGNERRKSVQSRKRLTALMTSMPLMLVEAPNHSSWRSILPVEDFESLLSEYGPKELHRQEVIWELIETEASFVHTVCGVQKVFALPLRYPDGRWINGVPSAVARLFDWLEDIFQFHSKLAVALERARSSQGPVALEIAEAILKLIPKLEVYQPYLIRFEAVTALIEEMLKTEDNLFGEFLKIQMLRPECGSLSFSSFLLKPVQRLMKYPLFFKQLFELTPPSHPDYEATKQLHEATEQLVRDMNNVKAREEDYSTLKDLESRLQGLPADFHIAIRERKLLRQGSLCCVSLNDRDQEALNSASAPATPRSSPSISSPILTGSSRAQFDGVSAEGMSKLMPITNSDFRPLSLVGRNSSSSDPRSSFSDQAQPRSGRDIANDPGRVSLWSNASSFSAASFASDASRRPSSSAASHTRPNSFVSAAGSESSASMYEQPQRPASRQRSAGPESLSPQLYSLPSSLPSPTLSRRPSMASILLRNSSKHEKEREREMNIQAFVFSDILVLCTLEEEEVHAKQSKSSKKNKMASSPQLEVPKPAQKYNVLEGVGIGRVLSVTDHSGKLADRPYLLELVILPMRQETGSRSPGPTSLLLSFKPPAGEHPSFRSAEHNISLWTRALQRSLVTSLKLVKEQSSILSPQLRGSSGRSSEDNLRRKRESILSSGLSMASRFPTHVQTAHSDWTRRSKQVTELVMAAARAGDKTGLVGLLQSGLPFPKSPSQQDLVRAASEELNVTQKRRNGGNYSHQKYGLSSSESQLSSTSTSTSVVGDNVLDEVEEEREERKWWALRLSEVRADVETEKEIDRMVEQLRSGASSEREREKLSSNSSPLLGGNGVASNRWSNINPNGAVSLGLKGGRKVREGVKVVKSSSSGTPPLGNRSSVSYTQASKENFGSSSNSGNGGGGVFAKRNR